MFALWKVTLILTVASEQLEIQSTSTFDSSSDQIPSDNLHLNASNFRGNYKHFSVKQKLLNFPSCMEYEQQ